MQFANRHEAGQLLAKSLLHLKDKHPVIVALPRGGVPVGFEIARALAAPLDVVLVRKISAPRQEHLVIGAIADSKDPELVMERGLISSLNVSPEFLERAKCTALKEIEGRRSVYLSGHQPVEVTGRTAIVVDDGITSQATMLAALRAIRRRDPAQLVLAVPVAPRPTLRRLHREVDEVVCLLTPTEFFAVGQFYAAFPQLRDDEVTILLAAARDFVTPSAPA